MKNLMIVIGNFLFRFRNVVFPTIVVLLYCSATPTTEIYGNTELESLKDAFAWVIALVGLAFRATVIGFAYIQRGGKNKKVYAENLVTEGMFGVCRNPLYVGNVLIYSAFFLMHGNPVVMLVGIGIFAFMYQCIVYAEEQFLRAKFGAGYDDYCHDVSRWMPSFKKFRQSTAGMSFNFWRVIEKDYSTASSTFLMLILSEAYENVAGPAVDESVPYLVMLGALLLITGLLTALVSFMKKRGVLRNLQPNALPSAD